MKIDKKAVIREALQALNIPEDLNGRVLETGEAFVCDECLGRLSKCSWDATSIDKSVMEEQAKRGRQVYAILNGHYRIPNGYSIMPVRMRSYLFISDADVAKAYENWCAGQPLLHEILNQTDGACYEALAFVMSDGFIGTTRIGVMKQNGILVRVF